MASGDEVEVKSEVGVWGGSWNQRRGPNRGRGVAGDCKLGCPFDAGADGEGEDEETGVYSISMRSQCLRADKVYFTAHLSVHCAILILINSML